MLRVGVLVCTSVLLFWDWRSDWERRNEENLLEYKGFDLIWRDADRPTLQVALLPVSLVSLEVELTVLVRPRLVTCAALDVCSPLPRSGESGTRRSTWVRSTLITHSLLLCSSCYITRILMVMTGGSLPSPPSLPPPSPPSSWPAVTRSPMCPRSRSSSTPASSLTPPSRAPQLPPHSSSPSAPGRTSTRSRTPASCAPARASCAAAATASAAARSSCITQKSTAPRSCAPSAISPASRRHPCSRSTSSNSLPAATSDASSSGHRLRSPLSIPSTAARPLHPLSRRTSSCPRPWSNRLTSAD